MNSIKNQISITVYLLDLAGCDRAEITASRVVVDPTRTGTSSGGSVESQTGFRLDQLPLEIFPNGADAGVDELVLLAPAPVGAGKRRSRAARVLRCIWRTRACETVRSFPSAALSRDWNV